MRACDRRDRGIIYKGSSHPMDSYRLPTCVSRHLSESEILSVDALLSDCGLTYLLPQSIKAAQQASKHQGLKTRKSQEFYALKYRCRGLLELKFR